MGTTFLEYQNELRLSYIYHDLLTSNDTIQNILERHGFTNYKVFRRIFFEHFHATPSQIRHQQTQKIRLLQFYCKRRILYCLTRSPESILWVLQSAPSGFLSVCHTISEWSVPSFPFRSGSRSLFRDPRSFRPER